MACPSTLERAERVFRRGRGILRTGDALRLGVHPETLYALRDAGRLEALGRGVWHPVDLPVSEHVDAAIVTLRHSRAVVCLTSALEWHGLTTQVPGQVQIALPPGARAPHVRYPPSRVFRFSGRSYTSGVERHDVGGLRVRVYGPGKTVADCFKFRNKVGRDIALEGLREGWRARRFTMDEVIRYARICRVERVMRPYLESLA